jgi:hypothetical protein
MKANIHNKRIRIGSWSESQSGSLLMSKSQRSILRSGALQESRSGSKTGSKVVSRSLIKLFIVSKSKSSVKNYKSMSISVSKCRSDSPPFL